MAIDLQIPLSEVNALIGTAVDKFDNLRLYRANSRGGVSALVTTIPLVSGTFNYNYTDSVGIVSSWYRVTLFNSVTNNETDINQSEPFPAARDVTTLTQLRQYVIRKFGGEVYTPSSYAAQSVTLPDADDAGQDSDYFAGWHIFRPTAPNVLDNDRRVTVEAAGGVFTHAGKAYAGTVVGGEQVELCNLDMPLTVLNDTIGDGLLNTRYLSRYEFGAVTSQLQYSLPNFIEGPEYVIEAWIRFGTTVASYRWHQYASEGRWWKVRGSNFQCVLDIQPAQANFIVIALDVWRPGEKLASEIDFTVVQPLWAKAAAMVSVIEYLITRDMARHNKSDYGPMLDIWTKKLRQSSRKYGPTPGMRLQIPNPIGAFPEI